MGLISLSALATYLCIRRVLASFILGTVITDNALMAYRSSTSERLLEIRPEDPIITLFQPEPEDLTSMSPLQMTSSDHVVTSNCTDLVDSGPVLKTHDAIWRILYSVIPILMTGFTIVGNTFVIVAICVNKRLSRKHTSILILNLAAADLLVGSGVMPLAIVQILTDSHWLFGRTMCRIWTALDVICCTASIFTLCIISVDRYIGVTRPLAYSYMVTRGRLCCAVIMVWAFSISVLLATVQWSENECRNSAVCQVGNELQYVVHSVVMSFFIPLLIILIVYYKIYRVTRRRESSLLHNRRSGIVLSASSELAQLKRQTSTAQMTPPICVVQPEYSVGRDEDNNTTKEPVSRSMTLTPTSGGAASWTWASGILNIKRRISSASMFSESSSALRMPLRIHYGGPDDGDVNKQRKFYQKHKKTAKTLSLVVGAFLLSWVPFFILYLISKCSFWRARVRIPLGACVLHFFRQHLQRLHTRIGHGCVHVARL